MTQIVGGLRARLVRESVYQMIHGSLDSLGWFDSGRDHASLTFDSEELDDFRKVPVNTAALADFDTTDTEQELGSNLSEARWIMFLDFFAENTAVGLHFIRDARDILLGKMASVGRTGPNFAVWDYSQATPSTLFHCQIEDVVVDRPEVFREDYQKAWYTVRFTVVDSYGDESDA